MGFHICPWNFSYGAAAALTFVIYGFQTDPEEESKRPEELRGLVEGLYRRHTGEEVEAWSINLKSAKLTKGF
jgi:hypothetical protein